MKCLLWWITNVKQALWLWELIFYIFTGLRNKEQPVAK